MKQVQRFELFLIPFVFIFAGIGMLWMLPFENPDNGFFDALRTNKSAWIGSHSILLLSTMIMVPSALAIRTVITGKFTKIIAMIMVVVIAITSILLAGQYAIDFVMPFLANGGEAGADIFLAFRNDPMMDTLFYGIPNLVFLALMVLSIVWAVDSEVTPIWKAILIINWACVLLGNLIHPAFQRISILALGATLLPFVINSWQRFNDESDTA